MPMYPAALTNQMAGHLNTIALYRDNPHLFDDLVLPDGLNRQLCIDTIMQEHGRAPLANPDPNYMQYMIGAFSRRHYRTFEKLYLSTLMEYNPIWNSDRYETEKNTTARTTEGSGTLDSTVDGAQSAKEVGNNTANHSEKETSKTTQEADTAETRNTDTTGQSVTDGNTHTETSETGTSDGTSTTDSTNTQTSKTESTTDTTTESTVKKDSESTVTHDISPENAPDYQPDDNTHTTGTETTTSNGTENVKSETDGTVTDIGNSKTVTHGETANSSTGDGTSHSQTDTTGHEEMEGSLHSTSTTDYSREMTSEDAASHTVNNDATSKTVTDTDTTNKEAMSEEYTHEFHQWGNIGVTTTQEMLEEERNVVQFNVYTIIADYYHREFCLKFY